MKRSIVISIVVIVIVGVATYTYFAMKQPSSANQTVSPAQESDLLKSLSAPESSSTMEAPPAVGSASSTVSAKMIQSLSAPPSSKSAPDEQATTSPQVNDLLKTLQK